MFSIIIFVSSLHFLILCCTLILLLHHIKHNSKRRFLMKKTLIALFCLSFLSLSSCSNTTPSTTNLSNEENINATPPAQEETNSISTSHSDSLTENSFPNYFIDLVNSYDNSAEKYNLSYKYPITRIFHKEKKSDFYNCSYNFAIQSSTDSSSSETIEIKEKKDGTLIKSYCARFSNDYDTVTIRDFIIATIIMSDPKISF